MGLRPAGGEGSRANWGSGRPARGGACERSPWMSSALSGAKRCSAGASSGPPLCPKRRTRPREARPLQRWRSAGRGGQSHRAAYGQHLLEPGRRALLLDEDERAAAPLAERAHDQLELEPLVRGRLPDALRDAAHGAAHAPHADPHVRPLELRREQLDLAGEGGGEEQGLPLLLWRHRRDDAPDLRRGANGQRRHLRRGGARAPRSAWGGGGGDRAR